MSIQSVPAGPKPGGPALIAVDKQHYPASSDGHMTLKRWHNILNGSLQLDRPRNRDEG